jgi:4-amino-4-deoxy-L-arabinose transferase-like glycosyltransferase
MGFGWILPAASNTSGSVSASTSGFSSGWERGWLLRMLAVLGLTALLFFARLGERALWSEEVRWAEIPREMQRHANYLWPTINGKTYYDKPLGSYWLVLLASAVTGAAPETAARLPCALSGLLGVALIMLVARRLYDARTALLAGIILATSFSFVFFARHASTDVETVTGVLAALWLFLRNERHPQGWWTLLLWLFMALTSLTKGLLGFVLPLLVLGVYASWTDVVPSPRPLSLRGWIATLVQRNRWLFNRKALLAVPLGMLVYLSPFLLSFLATGSTEGLGMVYRENVRRFYDPVNHRGPIYLYVYILFLLLAPWSLLLPAALVQAHQGCRTGGSARRGDRFALVFFWTIFLFFTLSASRRSYYLLPILPAGALLVARLLMSAGTALQPMAYRLLLAGYGVLALVVCLSGLALVPASWILPAPWSRLPGLPHPWVFVLVWVCCVGGLGIAWQRLCPQRIACGLSLVAYLFMGYLFLVALPELEAYRTQKPFAEMVKQHLGTETSQLALFRTREIVFYLGQPNALVEYDTTHRLAEGIRDQQVRWVIARRRDCQALDVPAQVLLGETIYPWENAAQAANKLLLLDVGR